MKTFQVLGEAAKHCVKMGRKLLKLLLSPCGPSSGEGDERRQRQAGSSLLSPSRLVTAWDTAGTQQRRLGPRLFMPMEG